MFGSLCPLLSRPRRPDPAAICPKKITITARASQLTTSSELVNMSTSYFSVFNCVHDIIVHCYSISFSKFIDTTDISVPGEPSNLWKARLTHILLDTIQGLQQVKPGRGHRTGMELGSHTRTRH